MIYTSNPLDGKWIPLLTYCNIEGQKRTPWIEIIYFPTIGRKLWPTGSEFPDGNTFYLPTAENEAKNETLIFAFLNFFAVFNPSTFLPHGFARKTKHWISNFSKNFSELLAHWTTSWLCVHWARISSLFTYRTVLGQKRTPFFEKSWNIFCQSTLTPLVSKLTRQQNASPPAPHFYRPNIKISPRSLGSVDFETNIKSNIMMKVNAKHTFAPSAASASLNFLRLNRADVAFSVVFCRSLCYNGLQRC